MRDDLNQDFEVPERLVNIILQACRVRRYQAVVETNVEATVIWGDSVGDGLQMPAGTALLDRVSPRPWESADSENM